MMKHMIEDRFAEIEQAGQYLQRLFGDRKGFVAMAFGHNPKLKAGKGRRFAKEDWREKIYAWPSQADDILEDVDNLLNQPETKNENVEIFINPALRAKPSRKRGTAAPLKWIWCDVDHTPDQGAIDRINALGAMSVLSGTNGNRHVYVELVKPVSAVAHRALMRALQQALGGDSKITENDVLRLPGTWNWKTSDPSQVWMKSPGRPGRFKNNMRLVKQILDFDNKTVEDDWQEYKDQAREELPDQSDIREVDLDRPAPKIKTLPQKVRSVFKRDGTSGDRSDLIHSLVATCKEEGVSYEDTHALLQAYEPAIDKWTSPWRIRNDVDRIWQKAKSPQKSDHIDDGTERPDLIFHKLSDLALRVDKAPKPEFLFEGIIVQGDYGILSAQDKAGKSLAMVDAAVSAASGTPWMDRYKTMSQGHVLACLGEGSERKQIRRIRAIGEHKGLSQEDTDNLPIHIMLGVPQVREEDALEDIEKAIRELKPVLLIIDPFYLAAAGIDFSKLSDVGQALQGIQRLCQRYNCTLMLSHHWNKTGNGDPHSRISGAGLGSWGRFLISIELPNDAVTTDQATGRTTVLQRWHLKGDEVNTESIDIERTVWTDDQNDLTSAMHYELHFPDHVEIDKRKPLKNEATMERVSAALEDNRDGLTVMALARELKTTGRTVTSATLSQVLDQLVLHNYAQMGTARSGFQKPYYFIKEFKRGTSTPATGVPAQRGGRRELRAATAKTLDFSNASNGPRRKASRQLDTADV